MNHLFAGEPDARQAGDITPSRFRPLYRALSQQEKDLHDAIKAQAAVLEALFERARELRYPPVVLRDFSGVSAADVQAGSVELMPGEACIGFAEIGTDYFGEGMKSLELAVMWTVKGLTSGPLAPAEQSATPPATYQVVQAAHFVSGAELFNVVGPGNTPINAAGLPRDEADALAARLNAG